MSYSVSHKKENGLSLVVLTNNDNQTSVGILTTHGALLHSFEVKLKDGSMINVIDNYRDEADLKDDLGKSYKSSKLSPFACRMKDGKYTYGGQAFEFANKFGDGTAIHGLLYNKAFTITNEKADDKQASVTMQYEYNSDDAAYPFQYTCAVTYTLVNNSLDVKTTVTNHSKQTIPMQDGWHPYFTLGDQVNNCFMQFPSKALVEFDEKLIPTRELIKYEVFNTTTKIGETFLDNCFLLNSLNDGEAACTLSNTANGLSISMHPSKAYPYLQIYTPPHRKSIAVENLSATPDCFNNHMGLLELSPEESKSFSVTYKVQVN